MSNDTSSGSNLHHIVEDARVVGGEVSLTSEERLETREMAMQHIAQKLISTRMSTTLKGEDLKAKLLNKLTENLDSLPLQDCMALVTILDNSANTDLNRLVALSGIKNGGKSSLSGGGTGLTLFLGGSPAEEEKTAGAASGRVTEADTKGLLKMNEVYDALTLASAVVKEQREKKEAMIDPEDAVIITEPVRAAEINEEIADRVK